MTRGRVSLTDRVREELLAYLRCPLTDDRINKMMADIVSVVVAISKEQEVDPPNWIIYVDREDGSHDVRIGFQDEDGNRRTVHELETEIHRRAVYQML